MAATRRGDPASVAELPRSKDRSANPPATPGPGRAVELIIGATIAPLILCANRPAAAII